MSESVAAAVVMAMKTILLTYFALMLPNIPTHLRC